MSQIIFYGVEGEARRAHLLEAAAAQAIDLREVEKEEVGELLGYFAGLEGYEKTGDKAEAPDEELVVFVDLHSHDLQEILLALREMGEIFGKGEGLVPRLGGLGFLSFDDFLGHGHHFGPCLDDEQ